MHNAIIRKKVLTSEYTPLVATSMVGSVTIGALPTNAGVAYFRSDDDTDDIPWLAGEWHTFNRVDLSTIMVKGTAGDTLTINGGTW